VLKTKLLNRPNFRRNPTLC